MTRPRKIEKNKNPVSSTFLKTNFSKNEKFLENRSIVNVSILILNKKLIYAYVNDFHGIFPFCTKLDFRFFQFCVGGSLRGRIIDDGNGREFYSAHFDTYVGFQNDV